MEDNHRLYYDTLVDPDGLTARQHSTVLRSNRIPYSLGLLFVEKGKFPNLYSQPAFKIDRRLIEDIRIHAFNDDYLKALKDKNIKNAEEKRQSAREHLNGALIEGVLNGYFLDSDSNETKILSGWWRSKKAFQIDALGRFWTKKGSKKTTNQIVLLEKDSTLLWVNNRFQEVKQTNRLEIDCTRWLTGLMDNDSQKQKAKSEYQKEAEDKFIGLGKRQFSRSWDKAISQSGNRSWGKSGRPYKN